MPKTTLKELYNINWPLLREQKLTLVKLAEDQRLTKEEQEHIEGLLSLLDSFQDYAVDSGRATDKEVFNFAED